MKPEQLISVIVPVYKTRPYLRKCVESLLNQTCSQLEILLIDDGSPDESGALCEELAREDQRIRVIHQENQGLSGSRNCGIQEAKGQWLGFVDSDDWVKPEMYQIMLASALENGAQMAVCGVEKIWDTGKTQVWNPKAGTLSRRETHRYFLTEGKGREYACNKLYRRELFQKIRYPEGKLYEDIETCYRLIEAAEKTVFCAFAGYCYLQREDNISSGRDLQQQMNGLYANQRKADFYQTHYPELLPLAQGQIMESCCWLLYKWYLSGADRKDPCFAEIMQAFRSAHREKFPRDGMLRGAELLIGLSPELFGFFYHVYVKIRK